MSVGNVSETGLVGAGDATYGTDGQVFSPVLIHVFPEEIVEILHHNLLHCRLFEVFMNERRERCQKTVGHRFAVNATDDVAIGQVHFLVETFEQGFRQTAFEQGVQESAPQDCPTPLVSKDESQGRDILHDALAVVQAGVGTRPKDAGDTLLIAANRTRCSQKVALGFHLSGLGKGFSQQLCQAFTMLSYTSGTIEMDFLNIGRRQPLHYLTKNAGYLPGRLQYGIDALRMQKALVLAVNEQPVAVLEVGQLVVAF